MIQKFNGFAGQLLMAMPQMNDPHFDHSVVLLCEHSLEGAMGVVINRPTDLLLAELFDQLDVSSNEAATSVYFGGPVQVERGFVLHTGLADWQSSRKIGNDIILTSSKDILVAISEGRGPEEFLVTLGYAGWGAGQLEKEVVDNYWLTGNASSDLLFRTPFEKRFDAAVKQLGIDSGQLGIKAGHD